MALRRPNNLVLTIAGALLLTLFVALQWTRLPLIAILALPLVLLLPGYALSAALPGHNSMSGAERLLWSAGLSIVTAILGGVVLGLTPWGLQTTTWVVLLLAVTLIAGVLALLRRSEPMLATFDLAKFKLSLGDLALFGFAILAVLAAFQIAQLPAPAASADGYTSLWIVPSSDANSHVINLGFASQETEPMRYQVVVQVNGAPAQTWSDITLQPGQEWKNSFDVSSVAASAKVEADLYRMDQPNVAYRSVVVNPK